MTQKSCGNINGPLRCALDKGHSGSCNDGNGWSWTYSDSIPYEESTENAIRRQFVDENARRVERRSVKSDASCAGGNVLVDAEKLAALLRWYDDALQSWEGAPMPSEIQGKHILSEFVNSLPEGFKW